jgi:N-acetylmuramoyl-L-alanine amidase
MRRLERPSPNHDDRGGATVDILVLHYTGMPTASAALERLCDPAAKVSAHYTIGEDGVIYAHVAEAQRAWHAGVAIGIELVNPGHEYGYRPFPETQVQALMTLCHSILMRHAIPSWRVLGHSDVAPARKDDPGELFPWKRLADAGIGLWPERKPSNLEAPSLARFGYDPEAPLEKVITAFQRHFRPRLINGQWDSECAELLHGLLDKFTRPAL